MIPPETIEQIAAANDIVDVIGAHVPLKRAGGTFKGLCPFHDERTPSFTVNPARQIFKCFGCGAGGSVFRFVMDYEHVDFVTAVRRLAEKAGIRIVEQEMSPEDDARLSLRRRVLALHAAAADWFHVQLMKTKSAVIARDYLKGRGLTGEVAKAWKLGYSPDSWDSFVNFAGQQGYARDEIVASGLVSWKEEEDGDGTPSPSARLWDRFRARVMFPICNDLGEVIAFSGRTLEANPKAGKYVNSPETVLFVKGAVLFGLHRTKRALIDKKSAIVCEGQIDLITAFEAGVQNTIAPQGTAFTQKQAHILKRYVEEVILCFDADAAGEKAAERSLASLLAEGLSVWIASMPPGEDPDSLIRTKGAAAFMERMAAAKDFFDFQLDRLSSAPDFATPRGRTAAARKLAAWVSLITDAILREAVMNKITVRLGVAVSEFAKLLGQPSPRSAGVSPEAPASPALLTDPTLRLMATVALHHAEARAWLLAAPWRELLAREAEAGLLVKLLGAHLEIDADNPAAMNSFLTTLEPDEEVVISTILEEKAPKHPQMVASDCWNELASRQIRRHIDSLKARLRAPELPLEEGLRLSQEVREYQMQLMQIARPVAPPPSG